MPILFWCISSTNCAPVQHFEKFINSSIPRTECTNFHQILNSIRRSRALYDGHKASFNFVTPITNFELLSVLELAHRTNYLMY